MGFGGNLLAGLVGGYADAQDKHHKETLQQQLDQKNSTTRYLTTMVSDPNTPPEHKQWAMEHLATLANLQPGAKIPKIQLTGDDGLPAVTYQPPAIHGPSGIVPITLGGSGATVPNPNAAPSPNGPTAPSIQLPSPPPITIPGRSFDVAQPAPPPQTLSPAGKPYQLTDQDRVNQKVDLLQSQIPSLSRVQAAQKVLGIESGEDKSPQTMQAVLAKATADAIAAGRDPSSDDDVQKINKVIQANQKEGKPDNLPMQYSEAMNNGDKAGADKILQQMRYIASATQKPERADAMDNAITKMIAGQAIDASKKALPMVNILESAEKYVKSGVFTPRQDVGLIIQGVRAMNPGTVRIPNKEIELELKAGSYGDRFSRAYSIASNGVLPPDQRADLMNVIRNETRTAASSAAANWEQSLPGRPLPPHLKRFGSKGVTQPSAPPTSSTSGTLPPGWKE